MSHRPRRADESGITIVELLIGTLLSAVVLGMVTGLLSVVQRTEQHTDEDSRALATLRLTTERLGKELRQARRIFSDSTGTSIHFWVDLDHDDAIDCGEDIMWELRTENGTTHLSRSQSTLDASSGLCVDPGPSTWTSDLVPGEAFVYRRAGASVAPLEATTVAVTFIADIAPDQRPVSRTVETELELRNVAA